MIITIIGSRNISYTERNTLYLLSGKLARRGHTIVSGGAAGSDHAAYMGAIHAIPNPDIQIWLPWNGFSNYTVDNKQFYMLDDFMSDFAFNTLLDNGVSWINRIGPAIQKLYCRNVFQILTKDYSKTDLVIYCADVNKNNTVRGGTAIAVHLAWALGIPTFNIRNPDALKALTVHLQKCT
jgi:hypothetical protein